MPGALKTHRMARNVSGQSQTFDVIATGDDGLKIDVSPSTVTVAPNATANLSITLDGTAASAGWHFGQIVLRARSASAIDAVLPVAANVTQGSLAVSQKCDPTSVLRNKPTSCAVSVQNNSPVASDTNVRVTSDPAVKFSNVSSPAHLQRERHSLGGNAEPVAAAGHRIDHAGR